MKKYYALLVAITIGALSFVFFSNKTSVTSSFSASQNKLEPLKCDLNVKPCEVIYNNKSIKFDFLDDKITPMQELTLIISGLDKLNFHSPSLQIYGLNMNMGNINAKLAKQDENFISNIVLSSCLIDVMRYRLEVLEQGRKTGLYIDFDLKF
ncbi:hypothetical protein [Campylobacter suis]|uniref:Periplasmic protein n=1 Tax=Campylobacter suis TaxID=2790657 RepID=A0ABM8Q8G0_9BACT|nr:hypothetical protein [Campylobacter suis]CAD7289119.1 hypothetical protein LMG8286_01657 [Campylobacter suis]